MGVVVRLAEQEIRGDLDIVVEDLGGAGGGGGPGDDHVGAFVQNIQVCDLLRQFTLLDRRFLTNELVLFLTNSFVIDPVDPAHLVFMQVLKYETRLLPGDRLLNSRRLTLINANPVLGGL